MKTAVITGVAGQDGSYLAQLLKEKGYNVVGIIRRNSTPQMQTQRLDECGMIHHMTTVYGDVTDLPSLLKIFSEYKPDEIYHLAAQSHVKISFDLPSYTTDTIVFGTLNVLEAAKACCPKAKIYLAGSSEMFGNECDPDGYRRETTKMIPVSPYGCSKLYGFNLGNVYRESYGMFICNGILFNHESPRRGINFVTNKVVHGAIMIKNKRQKVLPLGNLLATRDWGHAKDYVQAMWLMLQQEKPDSYVIATGETRSVREMVDCVFNYAGLDTKKYLFTDDKYCRPEELHYLRGDSSKAQRKLKWQPKISFNEMMEEMVDYWSARLSNKTVDLVEI